MIGKPSWFARRKYTGWGFSPKTWQGWAYIGVMILPLIFLANVQSFGTAQTVFLIAWFSVFAADFVHISLNLEKDERERIHEAIAERNALWIIVAVLGAGIACQAASSVAAGSMLKVDPVIYIALGAGLIAKIITNVYLDKKN